MPNNKIHQILDDSVSYPYLDTAHVTRAGLILSTLDKSKGIVLNPSDINSLLEVMAEPERKLDKESLRKDLGNFLLQFKGDGFTIGILVVPMEELEEIRCYPFSDNNPEKKFWPYDKHFIIHRLDTLKDILVTAKDTHPMASVEELDESGIKHMNSLSSIVLRFVVGYLDSKFSLRDNLISYDRINKKRRKSNKSAIKNDTVLEWV